MIFADGMRLALVGVVPGVLGAYAAARAMRALLFAPGDPGHVRDCGGVALVITFAGSPVPALRAVRVTPMSVLRAEWDSPALTPAAASRIRGALDARDSLLRPAAARRGPQRADFARWGGHAD